MKRLCEVVALWSHQERSNDGCAHTDRGDHKRVKDEIGQELLTSEYDRSKGDWCNEGTDIRLEQVCTHSGNVSNVVSNVVGDRGWVPGVVFGNTGLDLADEVSTDIGGFRVDPTTDTCEQSNG